MAAARPPRVMSFDNLSDDDEDFPVPTGLAAAAAALASGGESKLKTAASIPLPTASSATPPAATASRPVAAPIPPPIAAPPPTSTLQRPDRAERLLNIVSGSRAIGSPPASPTARGSSPSLSPSSSTAASPVSATAPKVGPVPVPLMVVPPSVKSTSMTSMNSSADAISPTSPTTSIMSTNSTSTMGTDRNRIFLGSSDRAAVLAKEKEKEEKARAEKEKEEKARAERERLKAEKAEKEAKAKAEREAKAKEEKEQKERAKEDKERAKEEKERSKKDKDSSWFGFGTLRPKKPTADVKSRQIGQPVGFQHVKGITADGMTIEGRLSIDGTMTRSESIHSVASAAASSIADDHTHRLSRQAMEELQSGCYVHRITGKNEGRQQYVCCSDDFSKLHFFTSYNDRVDKKQLPKEVLPLSEISEVRVGSTLSDPRHPLAFSFIVNGKPVDFEAFTPEDRDTWCQMFSSLLSFMHKQA